MFDLKTSLIAALVAFVVGAGSATLVQDWRYGAIIAKNAATAKDAENKRLAEANARLVDMTAQRDAMARSV